MREQTPGCAERKKLLAELSLAFERASFSPIGSLAIAATLMPFQISSLVTKSFAPITTVELEDKFLMHHINNITEFAKFNQLNTLDQVGCKEKREPRDEHFVRGLLMNLELLAHKW